MFLLLSRKQLKILLSLLKEGFPMTKSSRAKLEEFDPYFDESATSAVRNATPSAEHQINFR